MRTVRRGIVVLGVALLVAVGFTGSAQAQTAVCSTTNLAPGQTITVTGSGADAGEALTLLFNGGVISATTADGFGDFSVSGQIPAGTTPGTYAVSVVGDVAFDETACMVTVQQLVQPDPDPTPTPTPAPDDRIDDLVDAIDRLVAAGVGGQQQQQQQQQFVPVAADPALVPAVAPAPRAAAPRGAALPKTGFDAAEVGGIGTATLLVGLSLMQIARRRRSPWVPASAGEAMAEPQWVPEEPVASLPVDPGASEGEMLLPFWDRSARN